MANRALREDILKTAITALYANGNNQAAAARALGWGRTTFLRRVADARNRGIGPDGDFEAPLLPDDEAPVDELIERKVKTFTRRWTAKEARRLIPIKIKIPGPIGIVHFGDPHVDDDGCDWPRLKHDLDLVRKTKGLFAANVGDNQNNWVGRLAALYGDQETTRSQAWRLTEWLLTTVPWLYVVGGNHDVWSGAGDPAKWIMRYQQGIYSWHGVRIGLVFPNGQQIRVNCRHDWPGQSQWNPAHGPAKAAIMGWRDHILTCGHKHIAGWAIAIDPTNNLISHAIRVGTYKVLDGFADAKGFPYHNIPSCVTVIDPEATRPEAVVTPFWDAEEGADFLAWKRKRAKV